MTGFLLTQRMTTKKNNIKSEKNLKKLKYKQVDKITISDLCVALGKQDGLKETNLSPKFCRKSINWFRIAIF